MLGTVRSALERFRLWRWRFEHHDNAQLRRLFSERHRIDVGFYSYGCFDRWRMPGPMRVGRWCSIANTVRSVPINHPIEAITTHPALYERRFGVVDADHLDPDPLIIEDDVWIGHNAIILPGCKLIGRGSVIGAGAVVTRNVDRYAVVAGNPARKLRHCFDPELQGAIEDSRWWEMDINALRTLLREQPELVRHPSAAAVADWRNRKGEATVS